MPQASQSLQHRQLPLADAGEQRKILNTTAAAYSFQDRLRLSQLPELVADRIDILQVNVGKLCNMTCRHCHVDAGPDRREVMTRRTIDLCLDALRNSSIRTLDLTGGAPEMNPDFRYFVEQARRLGVHVIDRCNLTILLAKGYEDLAEFLAGQQVEIVASLPCYMEANTDQQRGEGAYQESIQSLRKLNALGYGKPIADGGQLLTLVYNPVGPSLPPEQQRLEADYRTYLKEHFGIEFSRLFTITNMPISRFLDDLISSGKYAEYMQKLIDAFNPAAVEGLMCRNTLSVGWDGSLYDCDFNQMLELSTTGGQPQHIRDFDSARLSQRSISVGAHCFGCTAGAGSGCQGTTV